MRARFKVELVIDRETITSKEYELLDNYYGGFELIRSNLTVLVANVNTQLGC